MSVTGRSVSLIRSGLSPTGNVGGRVSDDPYAGMSEVTANPYASSMRGFRDGDGSAGASGGYYGGFGDGRGGR